MSEPAPRRPLIGRLLATLETEPRRRLVVGTALCVLGVAATLRGLADAARRHPGLSSPDRAVLGLHETHLALAAPFLLGALVLASLVRHQRAPARLIAIVTGAANAYVALAVAVALGSVDAAASGRFGRSAETVVVLSARDRVLGLVEQLGTAAALGFAALAIGRSLTAAAADRAAAAEAVVAAPPVETWTPPVEDEEPAQPAAPAPTPFRPRIAAASRPAGSIETPLERYRAAYEGDLRFSPHRDQARVLLDRLVVNAADTEAAAGLDALLGRTGSG